MRTRRRTGSYAVGRARREAILDAATTHFFDSGYHLTSMPKIAADVGLSEAGLLHHFPTKKHLLAAVAGRRFEQAATWAQEPGADDPLLPLHRPLEITERFLTQPGLIELFVVVAAEAADTSSPAHDLFVEHYRKVTAAIAQEFERAVPMGLFRSGLDYEAVAQQCIAMIDGLQLQWVLHGGRFDLIGRLRDYLDQLARVVLVDPPVPVPVSVSVLQRAVERVP